MTALEKAGAEQALNNESYIGRLIWNKRQYRKNPSTERRTARNNKQTDWVSSEAPDQRIISDALWAKVKARQKEVGEQFTHTQTNRLNGAHRPSYLLSGILECAECGGPYAINGTNRYCCTNHRKRLPIDELGGDYCSNSKTIKRQDLEDRVITCLSPAFFSMGIFEKVSEQVKKNIAADKQAEPDTQKRAEAELETVEARQANIIQQISDRAAERRPRLPMLDDQLDQLESRRVELQAQLIEEPKTEEDFGQRIRKLQDEINPKAVELIINTAWYYMREHADSETKQPFINLVRQFIQKVVIGSTPGHQPATLEVSPWSHCINPGRDGSHNDIGAATHRQTAPRLYGETQSWRCVDGCPKTRAPRGIRRGAFG